MKKIICLILVIFLTAPAFCQEMLLAPPGLNAQLTTRDVSEYTSREQSLIAMIENKENLKNTLLADDFEVWSYDGNDWQSKTDWLEIEKQKNHFNITNLSVRHLDDFAIVCFLLETKGAHEIKGSTQFIVDIWRKSTNKLGARYISDVADPKKSGATIVY